MFEQKEKERRDLLSQVTKTAAALSQVMLENKDAETKADNADFDALARACEDIFVHGLKESMMQMMTQVSSTYSHSHQ
ncbi:hypothetical protein SARC_15561 [Sphaeroforma arctica JP610]|uniref:Uncharacterized protein n=1 Tax=Sphaeroforma arctica JP610 TaxID=667725 RepID=A0A0L0F5K5_9EUKA|nr:hypothetical protein SARC_15561 [Sphaeroforma arctica JP610]KNC71894.1 hypothetical protein SARC_15561 [Sphaeroforma arctica JP610]|eukprot:XP_014145796.1 hypothetical protein SARC_15561 [Sphaeroforma arctica JP610]